VPYLPVRCDWKHFCPSVEEATLVYDVDGAFDLVSLQLEVYDSAQKLVYQGEAKDCAQERPVLTWGGELNRGVADAQAEPFATPLRSPYTLKARAELREVIPQPPSDMDPQNPPPPAREMCGESAAHAREDGQRADEDEVDAAPESVELAVLYHSIEVVRGPWNATGERFAANSPESLCDALNELGYYAGPPARAAGNPDYLDRARERFRQNEGQLRIQATPSPADFEARLGAAVAAGSGRPTLVDDAGAAIAPNASIPVGRGPSLRLYLEAIGFLSSLDGSTNDFDQQVEAAAKKAPDRTKTKTAVEAQRLNRPLLPLEVIIRLKAHDSEASGLGTDAPRAVGPVGVLFRASGPGEDTAHLPYDDRVHCGVRTYIHRLFEALVVRGGDPDTNCSASFGGIRADPDDRTKPFWMEAQAYAPYAVPTDVAAEQAVSVPAYTGSEHPARRGRAGLYLHPSIIAGDRYQVSVQLSFEGRDDAAELAASNPGLETRLRTIEIWRRTEVLAVVGWPLRAPAADFERKVRARYAKAFVELDFSDATRTAVGPGVLDHADFKAWMRDQVSESTVRGLAACIDFDNVHAGTPLHLLVAPNAVGEDAKLHLQVLADRFFSELRGGENEPSRVEALTEILASNLRVGHPCGGLLVLEYAYSPALRKLFSESSGQVPTLSVGNAALSAVIDQQVAGAPDYVFSHEVGHCFWLRHHENAADRVRAPEDHDQFDHDCVMSYTADGKNNAHPHQRAADYEPEFCGKCNLKLRGWDIGHPEILALDEKREPDQLSTLFWFDAADPGLEANDEEASVRRAITAASRGAFRVRSFDRNAALAPWAADLKSCDIYHHVSHGNVRCSRHKTRLATMDLATPRYPTWCRNDPKKVAERASEEARLFPDPAALAAWCKDSCIFPAKWGHNLNGVIQWVVDDDSGNDIEFTYDEIGKVLREGAPRLLAFFSSCLLGWEKRFARQFIDAGTRYVIAFRSRYETRQALEFARVFYDHWRASELRDRAIRASFLVAAHERPHAEPVLFAKDGIIRAWASSMKLDSGDLLELDWRDDERFYRPQFPKR